MKPLLRNSFLWKLVLLLAAVVLFALSYIFNTIYTDKSSVIIEKNKAERYIHSQQRNFDEFLQDTSLVIKLIKNSESEKEFKAVVDRKYGIFLYTVNDSGGLSMNFWSNQLILPPSDTYAMGDFENFQFIANGFYFIIKRSAQFNDHTVVAYAMVPVKSKFFLETNLLSQEFFFSTTADMRVVIAENRETPFPVKSLSGNTLFYLDKKISGAVVPFNSYLTLALRLGGIVFLLLFIHLLAESFARRKKVWTGIAFLGIMLLSIRVVTYLFPGLLNLRQFELFDPSIYGSNVVQRSLGDLLFNSIFFCWFVLFAWSKVEHIEIIGNKLPLWLRWVVGIVSLCLLIYSTFILSSVIRSIVTDSKISFDVTDFSSLTIYTAVSFFVLACLSLSYYYFTQLLFRVIFPLFKDNTWPIYFAIGFAGLVYLTVRSGDPTVLFYIPVLAWLLLYTWLVNRRGLILYNLRINIAGILFWIFVFSISISLIMLAENRKTEREKRKVYANKLAEETDPTSQKELGISTAYLDSDYLAYNFHRFKDEVKSKFLRDSIIATSFRSYTHKYDTRMYVYDSSKAALFNEYSEPFETLNSIVARSKTTLVPDLYYYGTAFDKYTYITKKAVKDSLGTDLGFLFIIFNPKKFGSDALFPVLFKEDKRNDPDNSLIYSYAVYIGRRLLDREGAKKYPFPTRLPDDQVPKEEYVTKTVGDYDVMWNKVSNEKVIVITRKKETIIESITLFSYLFCSFLLLITLVQLISLILKSGYNWRGFRKLLQTNIRTQVHNTIIFISIFSFAIIGVATITFFVNRYGRTNADKLSRTMTIMLSEMQKKTKNRKTFEGLIRVSDTMSNQSLLQQMVDDISDIHGVDVNVFDLQGDLKVSSEPTVYKRGVLSKKIDPTAFFHLSRLNQVQWTQDKI